MDSKEINDNDPNITKFILRLGPDAMEALRWIQRERGVGTLTEVFCRAIATEKFLLEQQKAGEEIILENKNTGEQRILHLR